MTNITALKEYNGVIVGCIYVEQIGGNRTRQKLCKGIFFDDETKEHLAGYQYVDRKATRQNKKVTVSGKSPFWFEKLDQQTKNPLN